MLRTLPPPIRRRTARPPARLRPLVLALAAAMPAAMAAGPGARPPVMAPAPNAVPVPSASWRVFGSGGAAPSNRRNAGGGIDQTIRQSSAKAIYQWDSFDIGAKSSVTFDMALEGAGALNRVVGRTDPSRIFGKLSATKGGEITLINANGILFGDGARVDVGSLIASTLDTPDAAWKGGYVSSLQGNDPAFRYDGAPDDFVDAKQFVRVDGGAEIRTASGGRVFLFAKRVENAGTIETPAGQTVLAAGDKVYLGLPNDSTQQFDVLYASESNPALPALRGLVVEVGGQGTRAGSVANEQGGVISAPRGNITIVGLAVNQDGRLSATTSVSENGSIVLRAQGGANAALTGLKQAQASGELQLGAGSVIEILPDATPGEDGKPLTSNDSAGFVESRVLIAGRTVRLIDGARITAPGADVDLSARARPAYADVSTYAAGADDARIVLGRGVTIDVSGTTDTVIDGARNFVTTELLRSNDLKDAPLQKDGLLFGARATLDVRQDSEILGDLSAYRAGLQRTVSERMAAGGDVGLDAEGGVVMHESARIDVSGGRVRTTEAQVAPTQLIAADGSVHDLNDAPADQVYTRAFNLQRPGDARYDRWGLQVQYGNVLPVRTELGYTEGAAAGKVSVIAPVVALAGRIDAHTERGRRQQQGLDAAPGLGTLALGAVSNAGQDFSSRSYAGAVLGGLAIGADTAALDDDWWKAPLRSDLPENSVLGLAQIAQGGIGRIDVAAEGAIVLDAAAGLALPDAGQLRLRSTGGTVRLAGSVRGAGADVELRSKGDQVFVEKGATIDVSGRFVNQRLDGPRDTTGIDGGGVTLAGVRGLRLRQGSRIDVSGGAAVSASGSLEGGDAGSIVLEAAPGARTPPDGRILTLGGTLAGQALGEGGALAITAPSVRIGEAAAGAPGASLTLDPGFFGRGGFGSVSVDGRYFLEVADGTRIAPRRTTFVAPERPELLASGTPMSEAFTVGRAPLEAPRTVDLRLASSGGTGNPAQPGGQLRFGAGAEIDAVAGSAVTLASALDLRFDGRITSHGGDVRLQAKTPSSFSDYARPSWLWLGAQSVIDVSGTTVVDPASAAAGRREGQVLAGGTVTLDANGNTASSLVWNAGSRIDVRGASGTLDVTTQTAAGLRTERRTLASAGGALAITGNRDLHLAGSLQAASGGAGAAGGSLSVALLRDTAQPDGDGTELPPLRTLTITEAAAGPAPAAAPEQLGAPPALTGAASVSAQLVRDAGVADFTARAQDAIAFSGDVAIDVARTLTLDTRAIAAVPAQPAASARLSGTQVLLRNAIGVDARPAVGDVRADPSASGGDATLAISGTEVVLDGRLVTQGIGHATIAAQGDLQLTGRDPASGEARGAFATAGDLALSAARIYPATGTRYTIEAPGHGVRIGRAGAAGDPSAPASGGGTLEIVADTIEQGGALFAPQGRITLQAARTLTLADGGVTSVSGAGQQILYGRFANDSIWFAPGSTTLRLEAPPAKRIDLDAGTGRLDAKAGAQVDLSAGGELLGWQFVAGPGGSRDVFTGEDGAYAIVPAWKGAAPRDLEGAGSAAPAGREIVIGAGAPVPAGRYRLLPARYAMLDGAFLVRPEDGGVPLDLGASAPQPDGSVRVGGRLADAGTGFADALTQTFRLVPSAVARRSSEIRIAEASDFFTALAEREGRVVPRLPRDAGTLQIAAGEAALAAQVRFDVPAPAAGEAAGRGGEVQIAAERIHVGGGAGGSGAAAPEAGTLALDSAQLNAFGAASLLLGVRRDETAVADAGVALETVAREVVIDNAGTPLVVSDLVVGARERVTVAEGASVIARAGGSAAAVEAYALQGDGAALRVAGTEGAALLRTGATRAEGRLEVADGAVLRAPAGTLVLDATRSTAIAAGARVAAADATLTAGKMVIGPARVPDPDALAFGPRLARQLGAADALTLRAYDAIEFNDGSRLALDADSRLTLDAPTLRAARADGAGADVQAGTLVLANSTGRSAGAASGAGELRLAAVAAGDAGGRVEIGAGAVAVGGASLQIDAAREVALVGRGRVAAGGDLSIATPAVVAAASGADVTLHAAGDLRLAPSERGAGAAAATASGDGAALALEGRSVSLGGRIVLPAGQVLATSEQGVRVEAGSTIDVGGRRITIAGQTVDVGGGRIALDAGEGDLLLARGSRLDVGGSGEAGAGTLVLRAAEGALQADGRLDGSAAAGAAGGRLQVDTREAVDLGRLAERLRGADGRSGFAGEIVVRNREGDQRLEAGDRLAAERIVLQSDGGGLAIAGTLDASGTQGGEVRLSARDDLQLQAGASVVAAATRDDRRGGQVELTSRDGEIAIGAGARIDVHGTGSDAEGQGGRVVLRAAQTGPAVGADVAIAPIAGRIEGASRIDVQAVRVYEADTLTNGFTSGDSLDVRRIAQDNLGLFGDGSGATRIANRIAGGDGAVAAAMRIHAEAEIRSDGDLAYAGGGDWLLPVESLALGGPNVGDTSVTLRAAGSVLLPESIGSGFDPSLGSALAFAPPASSHGGTIRIVGGADLQAADALSTRRGAAGDVVFGAAEGSVLEQVGSTTGDVQVAAARDVDMSRGRIGLFTTGRGVGDEAALAASRRITDLYPEVRAPGDVDGESTMLFRVDGGRVDVEAGRDVLAAPPGNRRELYEWRLARQVATPAGETVAWWSTNASSAPDPSLSQIEANTVFVHGVATLGGGDARIDAGRDIVGGGASAGSSGYWTTDAAGAATPRRFEAGQVAVHAGRDIRSGEYYGGGDRMTLQAGGRIASVILAYEDTAVDAAGRGDVTLRALRSAFGIGGRWLWGLDGDASARVVSTAGDLRLQQQVQGGLAEGEEAGVLVPARTLLAAPQGSVAIEGPLTQQPVDDGTLAIVAGQDVTTSQIVAVNATRGSDLGVGYVDGSQNATAGDFSSRLVQELAEQALADHGRRIDRSTRTPVVIAAGEGDVTLGVSMSSARPVEIRAGGDIEIDRTLTIQQQYRRLDRETGQWRQQGELSLLQAAGDLTLAGAANIVIGGNRGEFVALAAGSIDLGSGRGIVAVGNGDNGTVLPPGGTGLTLVAGLRADGRDYADAVRRGFQALGGLGLGDRAGDVYAQLADPSRTVALGSAAAKAFDAADTETRLARTRDLVGTAAYDASIAAYVRGLPGRESLGDTQALAAFDTLAPGLRAAAPGVVLADAFARQDAALRQAFVAQLAATKEHAQRLDALERYLARMTGERPADAAAAIAVFEALPLERQVPHLNATLVADLRDNGRTAARSSGDAQALAYARGYRAIDALFPAADRGAADIRLASAQIRTLQRGPITLMAPGGSVNAGETTAIAGQDANATGIVTVAGGTISAVVRDDFLVNRSRVFSLADGDILLWASQGDIDAGRGAKTIVGAPAPVLRLNADGKLELDTSGSFTGSGIAVLDPSSTLDLYAPQGAIDAGEAGIRAAGNAFFGAQVVRGANDIAVGGSAVGAPPAPPSVGATVNLGSTAQESVARSAGETDDEEERRRRRARRQLLLDFLGFGNRS